jgi:hypothetical protein
MTLLKHEGQVHSKYIAKIDETVTVRQQNKQKVVKLVRDNT